MFFVVFFNINIIWYRSLIKSNINIIEKVNQAITNHDQTDVSIISSYNTVKAKTLKMKIFFMSDISIRVW